IPAGCVPPVRPVGRETRMAGPSVAEHRTRSGANTQLQLVNRAPGNPGALSRRGRIWSIEMWRRKCELAARNPRSHQVEDYDLIISDVDLGTGDFNGPA